MNRQLGLYANIRDVLAFRPLTVDMGAYEYGSWPFRVTQVLTTGTGGLPFTRANRPGDEHVTWSCTDLTPGDWTQEAAVSSAGDSTSWIDPGPGGSRRFYRVELK